MDTDTRPSLLPREAYRFWPTDSIAMRGTGRFAQRLIFKRQEFTDAEEDSLSRLIAHLDTEPDLSRKLTGLLARADLLRFIYAVEWDIERAVERVKKYVSWVESGLATVRRAGLGTYEEVLVTDMQSSGGFYTHGRDCYYRPILILVPARLHQVRTTQFPLELVLDTVVFVLDFVEVNMLLPGQVENWVLMVDMEDSQGLNWPTIQVPSTQSMREIFELFQASYPCRLSCGFIWRVNRSLWARISVVLSPDTSGKFLILPDASELLRTVNQSQLEDRFGGTAERKTVFWPPDSPEKGVFAAEATVPLGEYSSYQEYFPERSVSMDDTSSRDGSPVGTNQILSAIWPLDTMTEIEEGPTLIAPVRVLEHTIEFSSSDPPRREIVVTTLEGGESTGMGCSCFVNQHGHDCSLL